MAPPTNSAIGMALAGKSASVDIPKPRDGVFSAGRDSFTAVSANPPSNKHGMLPTPPNSISPNLPPHRRDSRSVPGRASPPGTHPESDIDLHDVDPDKMHAPENVLSAEALDRLGDLDGAGAITPGLLAKHHLPDILLSHGPLAIRHIMGYLTTSVPGFSRITSAKARRLVVAALEGRGSGAEGGGVDGEVLFEKVGWGRWDARIKGQPPRESQQVNMTPPGSLPSSYSQGGLQVPGHRPNGSDQLGTSLTANSAGFSRSDMDDEDHDMLEHEADKMSLDDNEARYAYSPAPEPLLMDEDMVDGDETDEEDWASIGAAALRAQSLPKNGRTFTGSGRLYQPIASYSTHSKYQSRTASNMAKWAPSKPIQFSTSGFHLPPGVGVDDSQERAAIEALLSLGGSM